MKMKKIVKTLSNKDLDDWAKNHQWADERENGRLEIRRRARKNKNK